MSPGLFIAGTNTEVGKTHIGAMIAGQLHAAGRRVGVYKPVASGCERRDEQVVAGDAVQLWEAAGRPLSLEAVCPQRFLAPIAPHRAAAEQGKRVDPQLLRRGLKAWESDFDVLIVEGAGGLLSPVSDEDYCIDLAADLGFPLVIVADNQLGVINATLQTLIAAASCATHLPVAGVVLNQAARRDDDASLQSNADELAQRMDAPLLAAVRYGQPGFDPPVDWASLARTPSLPTPPV